MRRGLPRWRRVGAWLARVGFAVSLLVTAVALHMPTPSGVSDEASGDVRSAWSTAGRVARGVAHRLGALVPDGLAEALDPLLDDKAIHLGLFLSLAFFWAAGRALAGTLDGRIAAIGFVVLCVYAGVGEAAQALEGRVAELGDWIANVLGSALGVGAVMLGRAGYRRRGPRSAADDAPSTAPLPR